MVLFRHLQHAASSSDSSLAPVIPQKFPSLLHQLESMLTAHQLLAALRENTRSVPLCHPVILRFDLMLCFFRFLNGLHDAPRATALTLKAITASSCNEADDLEVAELLGDALLKFASSVHVYLAW